GRAFLPGASSAWLGRLYFNVELQHPRNKLPVVSWVNPSLQLGVTMIGEARTEGASPLSLDKSLLATLGLGLRFADPRPGSSHRVSLSLFGGLGLSTQLVSGGTLQGRGFGAEAGAALGYNWKWLHVSAGASVGYDGLRETGREKFYTLTGSVSVDFSQIVDL